MRFEKVEFLSGPTVTTSKSGGKASAKPSHQAFVKKELATLRQRIEILDWYHSNGKNQSRTAKHFDPIYPNLKIKQPLVSDWVKNEGYWRGEYEKCHGNAQNNKRIRQTQHPEVTEMLDIWVARAMANSILLTGEILRQK